MDRRGPAEWTGRALAVLTAKTMDPDGPMAEEVFAEVTAPSKAVAKGYELKAFAVGMMNLATILLGEVSALREISPQEALEQLGVIVAAVEDGMG